MPAVPSDVAFTKTVKAIQSAKGSREAYARVEQGRGWQAIVTEDLAEFLSDLDMFYLGTANADGQPYIQYRGGPPGFLRVLDERTLGFADFAGNQQYITLGNLQDNPRAFIFLMDYVNSRRIKLWGTAHVVENDPDIQDKLVDPSYPGRVERAILFTISVWDINCPQHIHKRLPEKLVGPLVDGLRDRVTQLEKQVRDLGGSPA